MPASEPFFTGSDLDDPLPAGTRGWAGRPRDDAPAPHTGTDLPKLPTFAASAQFVLDHNDLILSYQLDASAHWYFSVVDLHGKPLRRLLCQLRPDWETYLPARIGGAGGTLHLPEAAPGAAAVVMALRRLPHGENTFVTLSPELAPDAMLHEIGLGDFRPDRDTFARMFLRLQKVETRLAHYMEHLPGVIFHQRADLSFSYVGPGCEALLGVKAEDLTRDSQTLARLIHPADERLYYQELDQHAASTRPFSLVYRLVTPGVGGCVYVLDIRTPVRARSGLVLGYEGLWLDITRQKIAEHRMSTQAWKENLCALTGGLLNDFGNVMTGIASLSELYHQTLPPSHPLRDGLGLIRENAAQAQHLVGQIIELNRESGGDRNYANLGRVIRQQLDLIKLVLPRGTLLSGPAAEGDWPVYLDETAFRQTLVNLALNARDAFDGPGQVRIQLRRLAPGDAPLVDTVPALVPGGQTCVEIVFSDNGRGIVPAHLSRIFDPFFTTRPGGRGAGLGLYHARLFAETHGGQIAVRSNPGKGTEIVMVLPQADLTPGPTRHPGSAHPMERRVRAVFLDAGSTEDDPLVEAMRTRHWEVYSVSTADHVRRLLREEGVRLDLLVVRHRSPDADLRLLLAEMRRDHPGLMFVLCGRGAKGAPIPSTLRTQVDLVLPPAIADRDAVDSLASLLRLP
jgi:signal transduction histidine kinase